MRRAARFGAVREGQEIMKRKALRAAFPHTLPVLTGYAFLGLAYGILMQSAGFPFWYPALTPEIQNLYARLLIRS